MLAALEARAVEELGTMVRIYTKSYIFIRNLFARLRHLMLLASEGGREFRD